MPSVAEDPARNGTAASIPPVALISVEHPGIIRDVDKGIATLGGDAELARALKANPNDRRLGLRLNPQDAFRRPIFSNRVTGMADVLVKVSVPKILSRKRKRGRSSEDEIVAADQLPSSDRLLQALRDNPNSTKVTPVGAIQEYHRFRSLPDIQYSTADSKLLNSLRSNILPMEYEKIKQFRMDLVSMGTDLTAADIPPPNFMDIKMPWAYNYRQSASFNKELPKQREPRTQIQALHWDAPTVPESPSSALPPESSVTKDVRRCILRIREVMKTERPILTRRALTNFLPGEMPGDIKLAMPWCGYNFKSGPWRDCLVDFGLDPRADPSCARLQALVFQVVPEKAQYNSQARPERYVRAIRTFDSRSGSHIFDGETISPDGKVWQVCDITDPQIVDILKAPLRSSCDRHQSGWIHNATWAKARIIMRHKISLILCGLPPSADDYVRLAAMPHVLDDSNAEQFTLINPAPLEQQLAADIRSWSRTRLQSLQAIEVEGADGEGEVEDADGGGDDGDSNAEDSENDLEAGDEEAGSGQEEDEESGGGE